MNFPFNYTDINCSTLSSKLVNNWFQKSSSGTSTKDVQDIYENLVHSNKFWLINIFWLNSPMIPTWLKQLNYSVESTKYFFGSTKHPSNK